MDVQKKLDEIVAAVGGARSMPMSASCVINRAELLAQLEEVRQALPGSLAQAQELIGGREQMVEEARREADRIIESAHSQRGSLISDTEVARRSQAEADRILADARREAEEIRAEADDYVDSKLANFEVVLTKTIGSVDRGREKLLGRGPGPDGLGHPGYGNADEDADAPERSADPRTQREQADAYVDTKLATFEAVLSKTLEAVGRGRQKLLGRVPTDDLGAHMAAQDAAGDRQSRLSSDADFLAGLAEPAPAQVQLPAQPGPGYDTYGAGVGAGFRGGLRRALRRPAPAAGRVHLPGPLRRLPAAARPVRRCGQPAPREGATPGTTTPSSRTPTPRTSSPRRHSPRSTRPASSTRA